MRPSTGNLPSTLSRSTSKTTPKLAERISWFVPPLLKHTHPGLTEIENNKTYSRWIRCPHTSPTASRVLPIITEKASPGLVQSSVKLRSIGGGSDPPHSPSSSSLQSAPPEKRITATMRQLESMVRLPEARACMHLPSPVQLRDVHEAYCLMRDTIRTSPDDGQDQHGPAQHRHGPAATRAP